MKTIQIVPHLVVYQLKSRQITYVLTPRTSPKTSRIISALHSKSNLSKILTPLMLNANGFPACTCCWLPVETREFVLSRQTTAGPHVVHSTINHLIIKLTIVRVDYQKSWQHFQLKTFNQYKLILISCLKSVIPNVCLVKINKI